MHVNKRRQQEPDEERARRGIESEVSRRLFDHRIVMFSSDVSRRSAREMISQLLALSEEDRQKPIRLFVNSPGGDVDAGYAIFDVVRFLQTPVEIICSGLVASAGVIVLLASPKDRRISLRHSRFLIHQPSSGALGDASDIEIEASEILKCRQTINELIAAETGQSVKRVEEDTRRNYWMSAQEALTYGLVGRIVAAREELPW